MSEEKKTLLQLGGIGALYLLGPAIDILLAIIGLVLLPIALPILIIVGLVYLFK